MKMYLDGSKSWVELHDDHTVVSWPGGHRSLDADTTLEELLHVIAYVIADVRTERHAGRVKELESRYQDGYYDGYSDGQHDRRKSA